MRKISPKKYAISLYESIKGVEKRRIPGVVRSFIKVLVQNRDLAKAEKIIKALNNYINEQENILEVAVFSVAELNDQLKKEIIKHLKSSFRKEIALQEYIDKSLIGGMVLKYNDVVVDGSIKKRIKLLSDILTS